MFELIMGLKDNFRLSVILPGSGELKEEMEKSGIKVITIKDYSFFKIKRDRIRNIIHFIPDLIKSILEIKRVLKEEKPDILWTNSQKAHIIGVFSKTLSNVKLVWHFRDIHKGVNRVIINVFSIFTDRIISISNEVKKQFFIKSKITVIYNGLRIPKHITKKIKEQCIKIGYIGQIAEWKGQINFLKVMERINNAKGYIIGDVLFGEEKYLEEIKRYIFEKQLQDKIILTGFKKDILNYICSMDMIVHLPMKPEPFGRVLMESMGLGIPVIAHDTGAIKEILSGKGLLTRYCDFDKIVEWIELLSNDKKLRLDIGNEEKKVFLEKYSAEIYVNNVKKEILEILKLT